MPIIRLVNRKASLRPHSTSTAPFQLPASEMAAVINSPAGGNGASATAWTSIPIIVWKTCSTIWLTTGSKSVTSAFGSICTHCSGHGLAIDRRLANDLPGIAPVEV